MPAILTADIHLTDNPRDADRLKLLPWLADKLLDKADWLGILGDLTDAKDHHSAALVNTMVNQFHELAETGRPIIVLKGNHDFVEENCPYFGFVQLLRLDQIVFINEPRLIGLPFGRSIKRCWFLPSTKNYEEEWKGLDFNKAEYIFCHATFHGALAENGQLMEGIPAAVFSGFKGKVYSGDIHVPQKIGKNIEYVGAPYRVRFGDSFSPRVLLLKDDGVVKNLRFPAKGKYLVEINSLEDLAEAEESIAAGAQVKIRVRLPRSELDTWTGLRSSLKKKAADKGWELHGLELMAAAENASTAAQTRGQVGLSPAQLVRRYAADQGLSDGMSTTGLELIKEAASNAKPI